MDNDSKQKQLDRADELFERPEKKPRALSATQLSEFKQKLPTWRAQADAWRNRLLNTYYAMKPGRRYKSFRKVSGRLGELEMHIRHVEEMLRNDSVARASEAAQQ